MADMPEVAEQHTDGTDRVVSLADGDDERQVGLREHGHLFRQREKLVVVRDEAVPGLLVAVKREKELPVDGRREVVIEGEADLVPPIGHHAASGIARFAASWRSRSSASASCSLARYGYSDRMASAEPVDCPQSHQIGVRPELHLLDRHARDQQLGARPIVDR
jgi:hypothetical protein